MSILHLCGLRTLEARGRGHSTGGKKLKRQRKVDVEIQNLCSYDGTQAERCFEGCKALNDRAALVYNGVTDNYMDQASQEINAGSQLQSILGAILVGRSGNSGGRHRGRGDRRSRNHGASTGGRFRHVRGVASSTTGGRDDHRRLGRFGGRDVPGWWLGRLPGWWLGRFGRRSSTAMVTTTALGRMLA